MYNNGEVIDGYAILHCVRLDEHQEIVAENITSVNDHYKLFRVDVSNPSEPAHTQVYESRDYLKIMREFTRRINITLDGLALDRVYRGSPDFEDAPFIDKDCVLNSMSSDFKGKVVVIKTGVLSPEHRALSHQLHLATGGFGCSPGSSGRAVFCTNLYSGQKCRYDRFDIAGVAAEDSNLFPKWARDKLVQLRGQPEQSGQQYESVLTKINEEKERRKNDKTEKPPGRKRKTRDESEL